MTGLLHLVQRRRRVVDVDAGGVVPEDRVDGVLESGGVGEPALGGLCVAEGGGEGGAVEEDLQEVASDLSRLEAGCRTL